MTFGVDCPAVDRIDDLLPWQTGPMSVAVAVVSRNHGAIAADSLHVDLMTGTTSRVDKLVSVDHCIAAFVGFNDHAGYRFRDGLALALSQCRQVEALPRAVFSTIGPALVSAYGALRSQFGAGPADMPFEVIVAGWFERRRHPTLVYLKTSEHKGALSMNGQAFDRVRGRTVCDVIGRADRTYDHSERYARAQLIQGRFRPLPESRTAARSVTVASDLVSDAIVEGQALPRPGWWPAHLPVTAGPVRALPLPPKPRALRRLLRVGER